MLRTPTPLIGTLAFMEISVDVSAFFVQVMSSTIVSSLLVGAGVWVARSWITERLKTAIKAEYDEKLETHKAELKAKSDVEIEKLRSDLAIAAAERHVRFANLHEMRAEVIAETYSRLADLHRKIANYVKIFEPAGDKPRNERRSEAADAHKEFMEYFARRVIFIPKATSAKLEKINQDLVSAYYKFFWSVDMTKGETTSGTDKWVEVFNSVNEDIAVALNDLQDDLRNLLGDES